MRLDLRKFRSWLAAKQPDEIVGVCRDCTACPIANFYSEQAGNEIAIFDDQWGDHVIDRGYSRRAAPAWVEDFIAEVDGAPISQISAARALEALTR